MGLELNLIGFLPIALSRQQNKKAAISYFIVQSTGSLMMLYGGIVRVPGSIAVCLLGLLLKMGLAPVHFWVPAVARRMRYPYVCVLLTWQKVAPVSLVTYARLCTSVIPYLNAWVGAVVMLAISALRPLLVFRGLVQIGWVLSLGGSGAI